MTALFDTSAAADSGRSSIPCHDPATGEPLGSVPAVLPEEIPERLERARRAFETWRHTPFSERRKVLSSILAHLLDHADELVELVVRDAGKTRENAMLGEIWPVSEKIRWTIRHGERYLKDERVAPGILLHKKARIEYRPRGVVGVIAPWNYPLQNVLGPAVPALMAGNAVICKVSEWVAWSAERIQAIFDEALTAHGYPKDLVQVIAGEPECGEALVRSGIDSIVFTGSMGNGRKVLAAAADSLTPVVLELGGKDPLIVCDDAHLERAVHAALAGAFIAAGQNCLAAERVLVMDRIHDDLVERIVEEASKLRQGPPLQDVVDVGALTSPLQLKVVEELVQDALDKGATAAVGGRRGDGPGNWFEPTVLTGVTPDMRIMTEETFGPILAICRVRDDDEAIEVANGTPFGLSSTIMTRDAKRGRRLSGRLVTGGCSINDFALTYMSMGLPFGGERGSGFGRLNGRDGLRAMTRVTSVLEDRFPGAPAKLYPVGEKDYDVARGVIRALYGPGLGRRIDGLADLAGALLRRK